VNEGAYFTLSMSRLVGVGPLIDELHPVSQGVVILWDADYASRVDNFRIRRHPGPMCVLID
jgi:hypothetical protein